MVLVTNQAPDFNAKAVVNNQIVDEALRVGDALQFTEQYGEFFPANWNKEKKAMKVDESGFKEYFAEAIN